LSLPTLLNRLRRFATQAALPFEVESAAAEDAARPLAGREGGAERPALPLQFVRHPRARRYVIRVADDGTVRVTVPRWGSKRDARAFAEQQRAWIEKQQRRAEQERLKPRPAPLPPEVERACRARASRELPARLLALAARHGLAVSRVSVRNQRWRWGSCSPSGHICLNWRLVTMPDWVRDYVLIHELMHLKRLDHSPTFWKLVAQACPEYQAARRYLRSHGSTTIVVS
jgi:predicted metal-dependent hydrolase